MKNLLVIFSLLFLCTNMSFGQQLGHSALGPYAGSTEFNNHTIYYNTGESFDSRADLSDISMFDGLLHNISNDQFAEYYVHVKYFFDKNQNGLRDSEEVLLNTGSFTLNGEETFTNYTTQGVVLRAIEGDYQVEYSEVGSNGWELTNQDAYTVMLSENNKFVSIEYGLYQDPRSAMSINIVSDPFRCFFPVEYSVIVINEGTVPEVGTVWVEMDPRFENIWYEQEPDHMIDSTFVGWDMVILPGETLVYTYGIRAPGIEDASQLGELYYTTATVETEYVTKSTELIQELECSYDPNDKLVNPDRPDSLGLLDVPIVYTIRFQNTGNAEAYDVVVRDTLSDDLDMNTFRLINTSHPDVLTVVFNPEDNHIVQFKFDNIFLPDSTSNLEGSNGHVMYQISVKDGTPLNTEINNTGHIYFDFNPAIVTNTTSTTMVDTFPAIVAVEEFDQVEDILVYPNPTKGLVYLEKVVEEVTVFDIYGREVKTVFNTRNLDLRKLSAGTYMLELSTEGSKVIKKLLITD